MVIIELKQQKKFEFKIYRLEYMRLRKNKVINFCVKPLR